MLLLLLLHSHNPRISTTQDSHSHSKSNYRIILNVHNEGKKNVRVSLSFLSFIIVDKKKSQKVGFHFLFSRLKPKSQRHVCYLIILDFPLIF